MWTKYLQPISKKRKWTLISRAEAVIAALPINSAVFALIKPRHWPVQNPGVKQQTQDGPTDDAGESKNYCQLSGCEDKDALKHRRRRSCSWAAGNSVENCQRAAEILDHNTSWHSDCSAVRLLTQTDSWVWGCHRYRQQAHRGTSRCHPHGAPGTEATLIHPTALVAFFPAVILVRWLLQLLFKQYLEFGFNNCRLSAESIRLDYTGHGADSWTNIS